MRQKTTPREDVPQRKRTEKAEAGPVPTLGELAAHVDWTWLICDGCRRMTAVRYAPLIERYGAEASSDVIRRSARCKACGHRGAGLQHPSWANTGWQSFPGTPATPPRG